MTTVNYLKTGEGQIGIHYCLASLSVLPVRGDDAYIDKVGNLLLSGMDFDRLSGLVKFIGFTERFKDVIRTFKPSEGEIPAGFRIESTLGKEGVLCVDLVRDISYEKNGNKRPTSVIFSADSANPYEIEPIVPLLGNLTCNPGIIYDLFINNPKANIGNQFKTRDEVMTEIGRILGPGCDISVELNNPFEDDFEKILDECAHFKEMLSEYRLVIKVPHTGPINSVNMNELLQGDKQLSIAYNKGKTADILRGHNLAIKLRDHGYRINFTLMFEPYQTNLALQAKPYFINSFIRHRAKQTIEINRLLDLYDRTMEPSHVAALRSYMISNDYLAKGDENHDLLDIVKLARDLIKYRNFDNDFGSDGLDSVRHNLRLLRQTNLRDTRLIICSMEGEYSYPDIDKLMADPEYADIINRVIITAEPGYLARFMSTNQVVSYQRRFLNAVYGHEKK